MACCGVFEVGSATSSALLNEAKSVRVSKFVKIKLVMLPPTAYCDYDVRFGGIDIDTD